MDGGCASPCARQLLVGVSVHRSRLEVAHRKKLQTGCWVLGTDFFSSGSVSAVLCCANVDTARGVHPESAHFIAFKVSAVQLRRCEILDPVESFVLMKSVELHRDLKSLAQVCNALIREQIITHFLTLTFLFSK